MHSVSIIKESKNLVRITIYVELCFYILYSILVCGYTLKLLVPSTGVGGLAA